MPRMQLARRCGSLESCIFSPSGLTYVASVGTVMVAPVWLRWRLAYLSPQRLEQLNFVPPSSSCETLTLVVRLLFEISEYGRAFGLTLLDVLYNLLNRVAAVLDFHLDRACIDQTG